ncbi:hypothetical protein [Devosia sp.]|uniref:hypothetical protein n=1 Tax=Devosia sp. TaxID=1871048 RepID=UPI0025BC4463|nr:hypothetical protein [Devosia sp.]
MQRVASGRIYFPIKVPVPNDAVLSRFFAKIALECIAKRLEDHSDGLDYIVDETQLDLLREHARLGNSTPWPVSVRSIYDANAKQIEESGRAVQVVHESDFLVTEWGEWYFVIAIFGDEYAINLGGPDIEGYHRWLSDHNGVSPLYHGKNSDFTMPQ